MLNELKSLELTAPTLSLMTSISQTQTRGLRNVLKDKVKIVKYDYIIIFILKYVCNNNDIFLEKKSNNY